MSAEERLCLKTICERCDSLLSQHMAGAPECPKCASAQCVQLPLPQLANDGTYYCMRCNDWFGETLVPPSGGDATKDPKC